MLNGELNTTNKKNKDKGTSFSSDILPVLRSARWALKQTWATHAPLTAGLFAITLIQSIIPAGLVLVARGVVNAVAAGLNNGQQIPKALIFWLAFGLILSVSEAVSRSASKLFIQRLHDELNLKITANMLSHAVDLDVNFFEDPRFQDILQRARENTATHLSQFVTNILSIITSILQLGSLIVILIVVVPLISVVLIFLGFPYFIFQWKFAKVRYARQHARTTKYRWTSYFVSLITGQRSVAEIKLLDLGPLLVKKYRDLLLEFKTQDRKLYMQNFFGSAVFYLISTTAFYLTFAWIAFMALKGQLTLGDVAMYGGVTSRLSWTIENAVIAVTQALEKALFVSNVIEFMRVTPSVKNLTGPTPKLKHKPIEIRDVSFTYPGSQEPVLSNISMNIYPGETIALVGENGAGKTTLAKLLARLYELEQGAILFDGVDIRDIPIDHLYKEISFVFQEFSRYEATAAENIAYGNWQEMIGAQDRVEKIAHLSGVHDIIMKMPDGYDTLLGRVFGKHTLSGGQWQQIAIARAFAKNASLLILDEPSSNLDARTEYALFSRFKELAKDKTTILISHRFSTVSIADRIVVLDQGRIVEIGTHHELIEKNGYYASLYALHQSKMM